MGNEPKFWDDWDKSQRGKRIAATRKRSTRPRYQPPIAEQLTYDDKLLNKSWASLYPRLDELVKATRTTNEKIDKRFRRVRSVPTELMRSSVIADYRTSSIELGGTHIDGGFIALVLSANLGTFRKKGSDIDLLPTIQFTGKPTYHQELVFIFQQDRCLVRGLPEKGDYEALILPDSDDLRQKVSEVAQLTIRGIGQ